MNFDFVANLKSGRLTERFIKNMERYLLTLPDGPVQIIIKKYRRKRTDPQNKYYFGVVVPILMEYTGYTKDEMHEALKWKFLKIEKPGMPPTVGSTKKLNTKEFEEYLENIKRWAAVDLSLYIPDPNEEAV